jgi:hypothetical protein
MQGALAVTAGALRFGLRGCSSQCESLMKSCSKFTYLENLQLSRTHTPVEAGGPRQQRAALAGVKP